MSKPRPIALLTDFGLQDTYVGAMKAVIAGIAPQAPVFDLTHAIPQGDIRRGAFELWRVRLALPSGSVVVGVVDPGVGTQRTPIVIATPELLLVGPDNGLFSYLLADVGGIQAYALENPAYRLEPVSTTFHGRDIFAPAGAHLATGVPPDALGPAVGDLLRLPWPHLDSPDASTLAGEVIHIDRFGNLVTSIGLLKHRAEGLALTPWIPGREGRSLPGTRFEARLGSGPAIPMGRTFGDVSREELVCYVGSDGLLEIAVRDGSAAERLGAANGQPVWLAQKG